MKKNSNSNDIHQEGQEQSKKLYRSISESARRLDDAHSCAQNVCDLFVPALQIQRSRFQEYCERLIFSDPILYGRKAEELLWRKAYYDVISSAKRVKKKDYSPEDVCNIHTHINAGVGHYYHFLSRLQCQFSLDMKDFIDFPIFKNNFKRLNHVQKPDHVEWAKQSAHRCLIYLGDLNRYKLEIYPNWDSSLAVRYYFKAVHFNPDYGVPHNQLGTLASNLNHTLSAVYHYMCCLACKNAFEGTENNLIRLLEKNSKSLDDFPFENPNADCIVQLEPVDHIKRLVSRFLFLVDTWYFNKKTSDIYIFCHQTTMDLQECFSYSKPPSCTTSETGETTTDVESESGSVSTPSYMTDDIIFKMIVICLLCIAKLQKTQSTQCSTVIAFTLAVYSQLVQITADHIYDSLLNAELPNRDSELLLNHTNGIIKTDGKSKKKKKQKIRRRRKKGSSSQEDSELSDVEVANDEESNSEPSDVSDIDVGSNSSDESDNDSPSKPTPAQQNDQNEKENQDLEKTDNPVTNGKSFMELANKIRKISPDVLLEIISGEKLLHSIRIISEWLISDIEIVKSCGKNTRALLKQIVHLLNFINLNMDDGRLEKLKLNVSKIKEDYTKIPLSEDVVLRGIEFIYTTQDNLKWDSGKNRNLSSNEESLIRLTKLISFGHSLSKIDETGISYNEKKHMFIMDTNNSNEVNDLNITMGESVVLQGESQITPLSGAKESNADSKGQLTKMKHMGQLWLAAEVHALENRVKGRTSLSPYLVLDADCLTQYSTIIRHLVNSKKFIVIIPSAVVSALDDLKREKSEARDAIRWLELQLHHGNRFCRAQRPQERASLPLIKYPKKKDKEMHTYIQIIECCHYLAQQQKNATNLVTLLIGNENALSNCENKEISYTGLARSAGINLEFVTEFYDKWRKSIKGKK